MLDQEQFLNVIDHQEAQRRFQAALDLTPLESEIVPLAMAAGRVLAMDIVATADVPGFDRANVDGFAVRAADTFGACEGAPCTLRLNDEAVLTGMQPRQAVTTGTATPIATGGMLPRGADAIVMIEYSAVQAGQVSVLRPVAPGAHVTFAGTDIGCGETVLRRGEALGVRDTGVLAALGNAGAAVVRKPRVAILSTGSELVPPGALLRPGQVYDSNSTVLAEAVRALGGDPVFAGIIPDEFAALVLAVRQALECDVVLLSGGTSKGAGDISYRVVAELGQPGIIVHGVALKPGKPLCLGAVRPTPARRPVPVVVLPGFPTSALFTFQDFVAPVIRQLGGRSCGPGAVTTATMPMRINSERGRTEYVLVSLAQQEAENEQATTGPPPYWAFPLGKGSGSVSAFSRADGFIVIPRQREYLEAGSSVDVHLLDATVRPVDLIVIGSHCVGLDYLLGVLHGAGIRSKFLAAGSLAGLEAAKRGECDLAGIHLLDPETDEYNRPFLTRDLEWLAGYGRLQGIVFRPDDARFVNRSVNEVVAAAVAAPDCVMVNRNRGSGTRVLIDRLLGAHRPPGHLTEARSHHAVAAAVAQGRADWGVAIAPVAAALSLGFLPLRAERYDFVIPRRRAQRAPVRRFIELLQCPATQLELLRLGFEPSYAADSAGGGRR